MTVVSLLDVAMAGYFTAEMVAKMVVHGFTRYWRTWRNRFDGVVSVVSLAAELAIVLPNAYNDRQAIRFIMFARMLRMLRIFADLDAFSVIFSAFFDLAPAFSKLGTVLLLIMALFGQVAIPLFGGDIYLVFPTIPGF